MTEASESASLRLEPAGEGVVMLVIDVAEEPVNTLKPDFAGHMSRLLDQVEGNSEIRALVITSGKKDSFVAGADIHMIQAAGSAEAATRLSRSGQQVLDRLEQLNVPCVAAIHGACLGGGLELALACRERVGSSSEKTKLGLPEVQLGLLPGMGGTQRLPRLVGVQAALDLLLTGRQVGAHKARRLGILNETVPPSIVVKVAIERAKRLAAEPNKKTTLDALRGLFDKEELTELALAENPLGRRVLFDQARKRLLMKTHGKYPAPERILEVVKVGLERGIRTGLDAEAEAFGALAVSAEASELMQIFFATQELKKDRGVADASVLPEEVSRVAVLGGGLMGAGIAYVSATQAELAVRLKDKDVAGLSHGLQHVRGLLDERVKRHRLSLVESGRIMSRVTATLDYSGFAAAQLVIEAVFEDVELKRRMLADVERYGHPRAIFASNTSSLPIASIAERAKHPERVIGMHYFSPVNKMPLLEIVVTEKTAPWVTATAVAVGKKQGKTVIVVRDGAGFYTSRILAPYLNEALFILGEGVPIEKIDRALLDHGFPVGPVALLDEIGIDVASKVAKVMLETFGARLQPPEATHKLIADDRLGRKNSRGFYQYSESFEKGRRPVDPFVYGVLGVTPNREMDPKDLAGRCVLSMVNEAVRCLDDGILRSARDGDVGAIFGLGFPPYLGGPFRYVDRVGAAEVVERLERLKAQHGERFEPARGLRERAASGRTLYA